MIDKIVENFPAIAFAIGSALFLAGNVVLIARGWR